MQRSAGSSRNSAWLQPHAACRAAIGKALSARWTEAWRRIQTSLGCWKARVGLRAKFAAAKKNSAAPANWNRVNCRQGNRKLASGSNARKRRSNGKLANWNCAQKNSANRRFASEKRERKRLAKRSSGSGRGASRNNELGRSDKKKGRRNEGEEKLAGGRFAL